MKFRLFILLACGAAFVLPAGAALDVSISAEIRLGKALPPPPPEVEIIQESGPKGPPPWAPAHGFRRNREYYYYPGTNVYFRRSDRMWVYLDGANWQVGVNLPTSFHVDFERGVSLTMETDRPYEYHDKVRLYYPADYYVARVRLKEKSHKPEKIKSDERHADAERGPPTDDEHGKSKGKGKGKNK